MSLRNVGYVTASEMAREPRMCHVVAYFDGYGQGNGARPMDHPRRLTADEGLSWREGFAEAQDFNRCHAVHGFVPCTPEVHP